ncbi:calcium-binding protein [Sphingobium sp. YR768]|uniref:calcium-binding protein n=1 Tax=Sphingobium sp. YR768 TaxID=1884365 RepID=UPI0008D604ED|nr:calcium-binding protein [Sphingobium sp. YR768]SER19517.1 Hemolysin-type calcium-binding repeat-containing protein [Sphingobium sp. YR768]
MTDYTGGSENNSWTITPTDGTSSIDGGGGTDSLTVNLSSSTGYYQSGNWYGPTSSGNIYDYGSGQSVYYSNIEVLTVLFGSGDSDFSILNNAIVAFNGGAGNDYFHGDFSASTANISFTLNETANATSTFTNQGTTLTNVERVDITTGSGNDSLTGGSLADTLRAGAGANSVNGGGGDDTIYSSGVDTVNGGAGNDIWYGDYSSRTTALNVTESAGVYTLSNGGSVTNVENLQLTTGSGNDSFQISSAGSFDGGAGTDSMTINWSASDGYYQGGSWQGSGGNVYAYDYGNGYSVYGYNIETLTVLFGSGDSDFSVSNNGVVAFNGGAGTDYFHGDFSTSTANISFTLNETANATSTFTNQGSTLTNVERVNLTTGSGNDSLTGGSLADSFRAGAGTNSINGGGGDDVIYSSSVDTVNGGSGNDIWYGDYSSRTTALNVTESAGVYTLSNGGSVTNVENLQLTTGSGNDSFQVSSTGAFDGGAGTDSMTINWSASDGYYQYGYWYGSGGSAYAYDYGNGYSIYGYNIEALTVLFGSGDSDFSVSNNGVVAFNGGAGTDYFHGDFSASTANISFTLNETANATSTFTNQGTTLTNVERLDLTTGSGNDSLTGGSLADTLRAGAGTNSVNGGGGDDIIYSSSVDTVNGGSGNDIWYGDYSSRTTALNVAESAGVYTLSNGGSVTNVENLQLTTGSGNDSFQISSSGAFDGGTGTDSMTINWSASDGYYQYGYWYGAGNNAYAYDYGNGNNINGYNIEALTVLFGSGDSDFSVSNNGVVAFNGGAGTDYFHGDFSASTANISFTLNETANTTSTFTNQGTTLTNVERLDLTTGSGNDSLTGGSLADTLRAGAGTNSVNGGAGDDTIYSSGVDTVNGGAGTDIWYGDYSSRTSALNVTESAGTYSLSNGGSVTNVENMQLTTGSGNDSFQISTAGSFDAGVGTDSMTINWSASDGYYQTASWYGGSSSSNVYAYDYGNGYSVNGYNVETLTVLFGSGDSDFYNYYNAVVAFNGGAGTDHFHGDFSASTANISFTLNQAAGSTSTFVNQGTTLTNVERLYISTGAGVDTLTGGALDDYIDGGAGNDVIDGGAGSDQLSGGANGNDTLSFASSANAITYSLTDHQGAWYDAGNGYDYTVGFENLIGSAQNDTLTGTATANQIDGGAGADTMIGGAGNDIYVVDNVGDVVTELAGEGTDEVRTTLASYTLGTNLERLTGLLSTGQTLTGNSAANTITGGSGNDTLNGGTGADTMIGGAGNDLYYVDNASDVVTEASGQGNDTVRTALASYALGANVENLIGTAATAQALTGNSLDNSITGGTANDTLTGGAGNDTLNGGIGADTMIGGTGNDIYVVDNSGDVVTELAGEGTDEVRTTLASYTLGSTLENLTGTATTGQTLTGNSAANVITGGSGNDIIDGGTGADAMAGGAGNDLYYVDDAGDVVTEASGAGADEVRTALSSYTLTANVERLTATGVSGQSLTGNDLANIIVGTIGADSINGGTGADTMTGGLGDDIYYVDNSGDVVVEANGEGNDSVFSSVNYSLAGLSIENLTLTGTTNINATGNGDANSLTGNDGNNVIDGGAGADTMAGGLGNDTYYVDDVNDNVIEADNAGTDTILSSVSYALTGRIVETLTLTGSAALTATGNARANILNGNSGANILIGLEGNDTLNGGAGNDTLNGGAGNDIMDGGADIDTVTYADATAAVTVNLATTAAQNTGGAGTDTLSNIENLIGSSFGDTLNGSSAANVIDGGTGADTMAGGAGDDIYYVDNVGDNVVEADGAGSDTIYSSVSYTLAGRIVETLILTGSANIDATGNGRVNMLVGNSGNNVLSGLDGADTLIGNGGNDTLDGGAGADILTGGLGDDVYIVDNVGDVLNELVGEGIDEVRTSLASYTLAANIENLTGTVTTGQSLTGNALANSIVGSTGSDSLNGGAGADVLAGGLGDDIYYVDDVNDNVVEADGAGTDTIYASVSYNLTNRLVETLTLTGSDTIDGTGNGRANIINGNSGNNYLSGLAGNDTLSGGNGTDILNGGAGNDILDGGNHTDTATYADATAAVTVNLSVTTAQNTGGAGTDTLISIEKLIGSAYNDILTGDSGNNTLDGGAGADTLAGGFGDDTYYVDNINDNVIEADNAGSDRIYSSVSYSLSGRIVEYLNLTGTANIDATGNGRVNTLTGNDGNNILSGLGGADRLLGGAGNDMLIGGDGIDTLTGGDGADNFVFDAALGSNNVDTILDYVVADDSITLDDAIFTGLSVGTLSVDAFHIGSAAHDADDRIIYNSATGALLFDADGNGAGAAIKFAQLSTGLALTNAEFIIG